MTYQIINFYIISVVHIYAVNIHVLKIYAKFKVNRFNSFPGILHADFEDMVSRKRRLRGVIGTTYWKKHNFLNIPLCTSCNKLLLLLL